MVWGVAGVVGVWRVFTAPHPTPDPRPVRTCHSRLSPLPNVFGGGMGGGSCAKRAQLRLPAFLLRPCALGLLMCG